MNNKTKKIAGLALSAVLALTVGAGVYSVVNGYEQPTVTASAAEKTVIETTVTSIEDTHNRANPDTFLIFSLSENDYSGGTVPVTKATLGEIQYYDYILIDGQKLGTLVNGDQRDVFYNIWDKKDCFATRWPETMIANQTISEVKEIKILAGCQFPAQSAENTVYEVKDEITFVRDKEGNFVNLGMLIGAEDVSIGWATVIGENNDVYKVDITCDGWTYDLGTGNDIYDWNYFSDQRIAIRDNIFINGVSLYDINTKTDDSAYNYATFPFNASPLQQTSYKDSKNYDVFMNPVLLEVKGNTISLLIYKNYVDSLCSTFGDELVVTVKKEICNSAILGGKVLTEDVTAVAYGIGYDLVLMDGNTKVDTMSVLKGVALNNLPTVTADYKTFAGWVDADGNPAPAVMPDGNLTLYAKWNINPYTLTIQYMDNTVKTFTFGVEADAANGIEYTTADLAAILEENLPANTDEIGYAYAEKLPYEFKPMDYTFNVTTVQIIFTITFVGENGEDIGVAPITFTAKTIDGLELPAVPAKEGYTGAWNKTTDRIKLEDTTLTAVYTEIKETTTPDKPADSTTDSTDSSATAQPGEVDLVEKVLAGCTSVVGGIASGLVALCVAAVAILKKKED